MTKIIAYCMFFSWRTSTSRRY